MENWKKKNPWLQKKLNSLDPVDIINEVLCSSAEGSFKLQITKVCLKNYALLSIKPTYPRCQWVNTLRLVRKSQHFAENISKCIFCETKIVVIFGQFHWSLYQQLQLTISQNWSRYSAKQAISNYMWTNADQDLQLHTVSSAPKELKEISYKICQVLTPPIIITPTFWYNIHETTPIYNCHNRAQTLQLSGVQALYYTEAHPAFNSQISTSSTVILTHMLNNIILPTMKCPKPWMSEEIVQKTCINFV